MTVVVPTKNAARTLGACLESLRAQTHPCLLVVVDNGSMDGTQEIAKRWADAVLGAGPERSAQRNLGARTHPAEFLGFIDADMVLETRVVEEAVALLHGGAGSVIVPERTVGTGFWVEVRAFERSFYEGLDAIEAPRFFRRDVFERAGGFDEQLTGPEDWDLGRAARQLAPVARTEASIAHDEGNLGYLEACRKKAYYAIGVRRYLAKRGPQALLDASRRPWLSRPWRLANRRGTGLLALKTGEALAVMAAWGWSAVTAALSPLAARNRRPAGPTARSATLAGGVVRWLDRPLHGVSRIFNHAGTTLRVFLAVRHGSRTLARVAVGMLAPELAGDVTFQTRDGLRLVAPARDYIWWPIVEVVVDDCYHLHRLAGDLAGSTSRVLDIGAHVGAFSCALAKAVPGARVTAVEPSAERVAYLLRNVAANDLQGRIAAVQTAVAGGRGRRLLTPFGVLQAASDPDATGVWVDVIAFEDLLASSHGPIDLVKMDCEGSEYEIVASASPAELGRIERLLLEYHPAPLNEIRKLFASLAHAGLTERWRQDYQRGESGVVYLSRQSS
ncbi:MAG: FkbM family methyltransferase [Acidimicrobiales bacterium]